MKATITADNSEHWVNHVGLALACARDKRDAAERKWLDNPWWRPLLDSQLELSYMRHDIAANALNDLMKAVLRVNSGVLSKVEIDEWEMDRVDTYYRKPREE